MLKGRSPNSAEDARLFGSLDDIKGAQRLARYCVRSAELSRQQVERARQQLRESRELLASCTPPSQSDAP